MQVEVAICCHPGSADVQLCRRISRSNHGQMIMVRWHGLFTEPPRQGRQAAVHGVLLNLRGRECPAGRFRRKKDADRAWQAAEARVAEGRATDLRRGRQRFGEYVTGTWLPNHVMELSTRQTYTYVLNKYLLPEFQELRVIEIMPGIVRDCGRHLDSRPDRRGTAPEIPQTRCCSPRRVRDGNPSAWSRSTRLA